LDEAATTAEQRQSRQLLCLQTLVFRIRFTSRDHGGYPCYIPLPLAQEGAVHAGCKNVVFG
jgi:hypothetical protein